MALIDIMGIVTVVVTLGMFMCGFPPCLEMYKTGSTKNIPFLMFVVSSVSCGQFFHYSLMLEETNFTLSLVNGVGFTLQIVYILMYLTVVKDKTQSLSLIGAGAAYTAGLYYYLYNFIQTQPEIAVTLGGAASAVTTIIVCLPVFEIIMNIKNKNSDGMPFIMLMGGTACGVCWLIYGLMLGDPNVYFPNIPGLAINAVKLAIIQIYKDSAKTKQA